MKFKQAISFATLCFKREELKTLIRIKPFTQIAKMYGVSDNAIRKWCKSEGLPSKSSEIKLYTDNEWENV